MGVWLFGNRALVWCLVGFDYEKPELDFDDLVSCFELCPWSPTVALHVYLNSGVEAALMCLDSLKLPSYARNPHVGSSISIINSGHIEARYIAEVLALEFWIHFSLEGYVFVYYMVHHPHRWIYQVGTLVSGSCGTSPSSSYYLREIVPERDPIPLIELSDSETVEESVARGMEPGVSIEEDPSEAESDAGILPELEGVAQIDVEGIDTFAMGGSLSPLPV
ncbi:hypothetical protein M9H77_25852 [Catharanthus roseus]|uniref:Uncharacterized protein n=1 Tax=Catharanthus roseus TaxID=4058 RepID=A0ACC0AA41_CATRO|nr:hypothetical protein M9H77_25852 [Catharanthus roseus]